MDLTSEQRCLDACRAGESLAYRPLVDAYFSRTVRLAHALVGNAEDARDLAQEAFLAAYGALSQHVEGRPFYPWLRGILINRAKVFIRSRNRARARRLAAAERPGHWASARVCDARPEVADLVGTALEQLEEGDRTLLVLKHVEGYTYDELAATLAIPRGTVMSRLFRARKRMREALGKLDPHMVEPPATRDAEEVR